MQSYITVSISKTLLREHDYPVELLETRKHKPER